VPFQFAFDAEQRAENLFNLPVEVFVFEPSHVDKSAGGRTALMSAALGAASLSRHVSNRGKFRATPTRRSACTGPTPGSNGRAALQIAS